MSPKPVIASLEQTCWAYPSQWEGRTTDNRPVYIRFRHGRGSIQLGPINGDITDAIKSVPLIEWVDDDPMAGFCTIQDVMAKSHDILDWPDSLSVIGEIHDL